MDANLGSHTDHRDAGSIADVINDGDDVAALGPSLNDLLSSDDMIEYNISNHHRHINERPYIFAPSRARSSIREGTVPSQELNPYTRYYSAELLPPADSHGEDYTPPGMRYTPRYYKCNTISLNPKFYYHDVNSKSQPIIYIQYFF